MESLEMATAELKTEQKINLIDGCFTATEASDIINALLGEKINFHKLQRLSLTESNVEDTCEYDTGRIDELIAEQMISKGFFSQVRLQGKKLTMKSTIHITVED